MKQHYKLHAYVCDGGACIKLMWGEIKVFQEIYNGCPQGCRYAVVETNDWKTNGVGPDHVVIDLWNVNFGRDMLVTIGTTQTYANYDAAIAATCITYDRHTDLTTTFATR